MICTFAHNVRKRLDLSPGAGCVDEQILRASARCAGWR